MIPLSYPDIRPKSSYYMPSSMQTIPMATGMRPVSQYPNLNSSLVNVSSNSAPFNNVSAGYPIQNVKNSVVSIKQPFGIISRIDTETSISDIISQNITVKLNINPEYGVSGPVIKKSLETGRQKQLSFQKGLQQLISVRQHIRQTKAAILHLIPLIQLEVSKISDAIEIEFKNGIPDRSKILFHLFYQRQYDTILKSLEQYKLDITTAVDIMRKRNNIRKQEFEDIIRITNNSATYVKKLISELPTIGWNSSQNIVDYRALVAIAEKQFEVIQKLKILESNINNKNYYYRQKPSSMTQSVTKPFRTIDTTLVPIAPVKIERPGTPRYR